MSPVDGNRNHPLQRVPPMTTDARDYIEFGAATDPELLRYHAATETLDNIAVAVARLPGVLTRPQRERSRIIARELQRKARGR